MSFGDDARSVCSFVRAGGFGRVAPCPCMALFCLTGSIFFFYCTARSSLAVEGFGPSTGDLAVRRFGFLFFTYYRRAVGSMKTTHTPPLYFPFRCPAVRSKEFSRAPTAGRCSLISLLYSILFSLQLALFFLSFLSECEDFLCRPGESIWFSGFRYLPLRYFLLFCPWNRGRGSPNFLFARMLLCVR